MSKGLRPYREIKNIFEKVDLTIWDKKSNKPIEIIDLVLDLVNHTKTEEEFIADLEAERFTETINEFIELNESALEFYAQHKKEIDSDKRKSLVFQKKFRIQNLVKLRQDFKEKFYYTPEFYDEEFREKILKSQATKCGLCGKDLSKIIPHFHHIDYNKTNCAEANLIFLCPRCHGITNSNRVFWKNLLVEKKLNPEHI